ncbi:MAG: vitamin transporter [Abditibacteriota bacterium]|nr:vitamin transporter [Abditibacteriota bacterium]
MKNTILYLAALMPFSLVAQAQQSTPTPQPTQAISDSESGTDEREVEIIVTPTRNPRPLTDATSSVTLIGRDRIAEKKPVDIIDIVRQAPSVAIAQSGTRGKSASIFLRGSNSNQTLVLIDGVRANSPADGRFDFGTVAAENIERIEVLRGPQSALYGSDAIGGVVNIVTRRGQGPFRTGGGIEFGNFSTNRQIVSARGEVGKGALSFSASRQKSDGSFANDDFRGLNASLRYDHNLGQSSQLALIGRVEDSEIGTPGQQFLGFDPNARSKPRNLFGTVQFTNEARRDDQILRRDRIILGAVDRRLQYNNPANPGAAFSWSSNSRLNDKIYLLDAQSTFNRGAHAITIGGELRQEKAAGNTVSSFGNTVFNQATTTRALFLQDEFRSGRFALVPGLRFEDNSQYGSDVNGRLAASYDLDTRSKLKASAGTGFRAPAINELYFPQFGDPNLRPEESRGFEVGYERQTARGGRLEVTAFTNRFRNLIGTVATPRSPQYPFGFKAGNAATARTQGLEFSVSQPFGNGFTAILNHAFLSTSSSAGPLLRRPKFVTSADLLYRRNKIGADLGLNLQGRRFDNDFAAPPFGNGRGAGFYTGYTRLDLTVSYDLRPGVQLYTRAQNLLNRRYEEVAGFPAPRLNFVVGLQTQVF